MAVAYLDSATASGTSVSSLTTGSVDGSGSDRLITAWIGENDVDNDSVSGVTWDVGTPEDLTDSVSHAWGTYYGIYLYTLAGQTSATDTITASFGDTIDSAAVIAVSYTGVDQSTPLGDTQFADSASGSQTGHDLTMTGASTGDRIAGILYNVETSTHTPDSPATEREEVDAGGTYRAHISVFDQDGATAQIGSDTANASGQKGMIAAVINASASAVSGSLSETLADFTSTASGYTLAGSLSETLADFTSTASGTAKLVGSLSETLEDFASTVSGTVTSGPSGSLSETLDDFTSTASGEVVVTGSLAETLEGMSSTVSGNVVGFVTGSLAETMADFASSAAGNVITVLSGSLAETLDNTTSAGAGTATILVSGSLAETLDDFTSTSESTLVLSKSNADAIMSVLVGLGYSGTLADMLVKYYQANGATSSALTTAEREFLLARGVTNAESIADMWVEFFVAEGYAGSLHQGMRDFWLINGGAV